MVLLDELAGGLILPYLEEIVSLEFHSPEFASLSLDTILGMFSNTCVISSQDLMLFLLGMLGRSLTGVYLIELFLEHVTVRAETIVNSKAPPKYSFLTIGLILKPMSVICLNFHRMRYHMIAPLSWWVSFSSLSSGGRGDCVSS